MNDLARDIDRQREFLVRWLPYALVAASFAIAAATAPALDTQGSVPVVGALGALAVAWHWYAVDRRWGMPLDDRLGRAYVAGRTVLAFVIAWVNPFFAIFALTGYLDADRYLPRRGAIAVMVATAVTMAGAQSGGLPPSSVIQAVGFAGLFALNAGIVVFLHRLAANEAALVTERDEAMAELERANGRLTDALAENDELHARLLAHAHEAGVHDERERLALEIHDTIAQHLIGIITQLDAAARAVDPAAAGRHHDRATRLARETLAEARRSVQGLTPHQLADQPLTDAVRELVGDWSAATGVAADIVVDGAPERLHPDIEATILRVAQEALTNAAKHAEARRVGVALAYMGDVVTLDVRDDGIGFDIGASAPCTAGIPTGASGTGNGLSGMRHRARRVAGTLAVESEPDAGTAVSLQVPAVPASSIAAPVEAGDR